MARRIAARRGSPHAYAALSNTAAIEAAGLAPAQPYLDRIAAVRTRDDLLAAVRRARLCLADRCIGVSCRREAERALCALSWARPGSACPTATIIWSIRPLHLEIRAKYLDYLAFLLGKAGYADAKGCGRSR